MSLSSGPNPVARSKNLVISQASDDWLVYDTDNHSIHNLNSVAHAVWTLCDGTRSADMISVETGFAEEAVHMALGKLLDVSLIEGYVRKATRRSSRRSMMKTGAIAGVAGIPILSSVTAATAAGIESCGTPIPADGFCDPLKNCCALVGMLQLSCAILGGSGGMYTCQS